MRHSAMRFVAIAALTAGCSASGSDALSHGPSFDGVDASNGDASRAPEDAGATDAAQDDAAPSDARVADAADGSTAPDASAADAASDAPIDAAACTATTAVLAGGSGALFGASAVGAGVFSAQTLAGSSLSAPAIAPFGNAFQAMFRGAANALTHTDYASSWSAPGAIAQAGALDQPALAALGGALHAVYLGTNNRYYHGTFNGTAWDQASDPVAPPNDAGVQAFGPAAASAVGVDGALLIAYEGNDLHLYTQSWTAAAGWKDGVALGTASLYANVGPTIVALSGGASDLLVVFVGSDTKLQFAVRDAVAKTWSTAAVIDATAFTHFAVSLAPMTAGRAALVYRGTDDKAYAMTFTPSAATPWSSPPAPLAGASNPVVAAVPSIASGVCGDDAVAAFVDAGTVRTARLAGSTWTAGGAVSGISGVTYAAIATRP